MKKENRFKENDKVFAKVKGYPAWPAIVLEDLGKKYKVRFYGTGEIGRIKVEDLFYYTKNKQKMLKPSKRKDFNDSVAEIEEAIKAAGTDGSPDFGTESSDTSNLNDSMSVSSDTESTPVKKRKRSLSVARSDDTTPSKSKKEKLNVALVKPNTFSPLNVVKYAALLEENNRKEASNEEKDKRAEEHAKSTGVDKTSVVLDRSTGKIIPPEKYSEQNPNIQNYVMEKELEAFIAFGEHVEAHKDTYLKMPVEERTDSKLQILPFVIDKKGIGIVFHKNWPLRSFKNEHERALYDKELSERAINLKKSFKIEHLKESPEVYCEIPEDSPENLNKILEERILELQQDVFKKLKIEYSLLSFDSKIKDSLQLEKAEPKEAIDVLNKMLELDLNVIMLKKHAHVVDMVRRLRKYVGNLENWNLSKEEEKSFKEEAAEIRKVALKLYMQFIKIAFKSTEIETFWDSFNAISTKFREETKNLTEADLYMLSCEPHSRKNFLNNYFLKDLPFEHQFSKDK